VKPLIATPCYGGVLCLNYVTSIIRLRTAASQLGMELEFYFRSGESLITRARNDCVSHFMDDPSFTHLFWIDADIGFEPKAAFRLLNSGYDVVAGVYPKKGENAGFAADVSDLVVGDDGFAPIDEAPTGFMCIKRSVIEDMSRAGIGKHEFFDTMHVDGGYLSEDYAFCRRWSSIGGKVYVDARSDLTHQGTKLYSGQVGKSE
jgi:hypothetical protein